MLRLRCALFKCHAWRCCEALQMMQQHAARIAWLTLKLMIGDLSHNFTVSKNNLALVKFIY